MKGFSNWDLQILQNVLFAKLKIKTFFTFFYECTFSKNLWRQIKFHFREIDFPEITPESVFLGFYLIDNSLVNIVNIIFKITLYKARHKGKCYINQIISKLLSIRQIEENITMHDPRKRNYNLRKWENCPESLLSVT